MDEADFYKEIRDQIKHEDNLCNNRMTWLITLQSFLFAGYGLTLNSQVSASLPSLDKEKIDKVTNLIYESRDAFCLIGILSSSIILISLVGARISVLRLVNTWYKSGYYDEIKFPPVVGTYSKRWYQGTLLGQIPLYGIPLSALTTWVYLYCGTVYSLSVAGISSIIFVVFVIFYLYSIAPEKPNEENL